MNGDLIDDEDDAWSYSFPPSTESLPMQETTEENGGYNMSNESGKIYPGGLNRLANKLEIDTSSQISSNSSINAKAKDNKDHTKDRSTTSSVSSISLQSPFISKSTPANPYTTREDASSTISREGYIEDNHEQDKFASSKKTFNDLANSAKMSQESDEIEEKIPKTPKTSVDKDHNTDFEEFSTPSPKVISYRKSKRSISTGSVHYDQFSLKDSFDSRLYVDEFYKDTQYRYATMKRNTDFHQLFRSLDLTYRLIDDFSCALSREILLQGRIYITEQNICFNSNLLGWITNLVIPLEDIIRFEKKSTAGLFPNGISIETKDSKHNFASFLSRDSTFDFMKSVWHNATGKTMEDESKQPERYTVDENGVVSDNSLSYPENSPKFESYILSIDEDNERSNADEEDEDKTSIREDSSQIDLSQQENVKVMKFNKDSNFRNSGPDTHAPTSIPKDYVSENNEIELCDELIDAPLGIVFEILFGSNDTSFQSRFIESQNGSEISEFVEFHPSKEDESILERSYVYRKALGYSIGPKSTKCEASEIIEHLDLADHAVVLTTTVTPDVPSGNSFAVKTRYCFSWDVDNKTRLKMSYFIEWTGGSWIKSVIEKQSLSGQNVATKMLLESLRKEISKSTYLEHGIRSKEKEVTISKLPSEDETILNIPEQKIEVSVTDKSLGSDFVKNNIVYVCYFLLSSLVLILLLQLKMFRLVNESNNLMRDQILIDAQVLHAINAITKNSGIVNSGTEEINIDEESSGLWSFVQKRHNRKLNDLEKLEYLTFQIGALRVKEIETNQKIKLSPGNIFRDIKKQIEEFEYQEFLNFDKLRETLGELL